VLARRGSRVGHGHGALVRTAALTLHQGPVPQKRGASARLGQGGRPRVKDMEGEQCGGLHAGPSDPLYPVPMTAELRPHFPHSLLNDIPANDM